MTTVGYWGHVRGSRPEGGAMTDKRKLRRRLAAEAAAMKRRLERAVVPNPGGPVLGRANIGDELSERTRSTA